MAVRQGADFIQCQLSAAEERRDVAALAHILACNMHFPGVQQQAAGALVRLVQADGATVALACAKAHVMEILFMTQKAHRTHAGLQLECVRLLSELHTHTLPWSIPVHHCAIDGAVAALSVHGAAHAELALDTCSYIIALTTCASARHSTYGRVLSRAAGHAVGNGAVPALLAVLAAHSERNAKAVARAHKRSPGL
jgi:hypothetical protein